MRVHTTTIHPHFSDFDAAAIVYHARYAGYFDDSYIRAINENGLVWEDHLIHDFYKPIVESKVNFFSPIRIGDEVTIHSVITEVREKFYRSDHVIIVQRDGKTIKMASGYLSRVTVDTKQFKPKPIPAILRDILLKYHVTAEQWEKYVFQLTKST